jgi:hypothetical protein
LVVIDPSNPSGTVVLGAELTGTELPPIVRFVICE